ncbi:hypothetical protein N7537_008071 [Penicillium hordei]|uniref:Uncharacterized protein n=1 Tax=Penicillium hordei TaxID=40994 RepID=A0AAD6DZR0_9EURO|nr:uncharacterized protein N7537_008071 [Penicillium hordei]KAJ5597987.1 hypothetical protein N7537_008071 [Penicillium hordei]
MTELVETSKSMTPSDTNQPETLDIMELTSRLGVSRNVSNPLLLLIFMAGAAYIAPLDRASMSPWLLDVAEEYIFRKVSNLPATPPPKDSAAILPTVQLIQTALIIEMLQFGRDDMLKRRRIRIARNRASYLPSGHWLKRRTPPKTCDEQTWRILVAEEMCIRSFNRTFAEDSQNCMLGFSRRRFSHRLLQKSPVLIDIWNELRLPWNAELWEAGSASAFSRIVKTNPTENPLPPLKEVVTQLLDTPTSENSIPWSLSLSSEHLLIFIYAINSLPFQARVGLLKYLPLDAISRAAGNWKRIWDTLIGAEQEKILHLGYPNHAEELRWLLKATLEVSDNQKQDSRISRVMLLTN